MISTSIRDVASTFKSPCIRFMVNHRSRTNLKRHGTASFSLLTSLHKLNNSSSLELISKMIQPNNVQKVLSNIKGKKESFFNGLHLRKCQTYEILTIEFHFKMIGIGWTIESLLFLHLQVIFKKLKKQNPKIQVQTDVLTLKGQH